MLHTALLLTQNLMSAYSILQVCKVKYPGDRGHTDNEGIRIQIERLLVNNPDHTGWPIRPSKTSMREGSKRDHGLIACSPGSIIVGLKRILTRV